MFVQLPVQGPVWRSGLVQMAKVYVQGLPGGVGRPIP